MWQALANLLVKRVVNKAANRVMGGGGGGASDDMLDKPWMDTSQQQPQSTWAPINMPQRSNNTALPGVVQSQQGWDQGLYKWAPMDFLKNRINDRITGRLGEFRDLFGGK